MKKQSGVTLLEMMLVMVIAAAMVSMLIGYVQQKTAEMRRDRVALQMEQILNAGLAYYVNKTTWPVTTAPNCPAGTETINILQTQGYLPTGTIVNPWGKTFNITCNAATGTFSVSTDVTKTYEANILAGRVPMASIAGTVVTAMVSIPGQNLNNARAVNFAGMYKSGGCVPAPKCPMNMKPAIFVIPTSVTGYNDPMTIDPWTGTPNAANMYPITSFTAFARGDGNGDPTAGAPQDCATKTSPNWISCDVAEAGTQYWRVCLAIITEKGVVYPSASESLPTLHGANMGSILAITRCVPNAGVETPHGSSFNVFTPNAGYNP
jgi:prepilin-type N-terminal cleavage/methylation domain-containing protein